MPFILPPEVTYDFNAPSIIPLSMGILAASLRSNDFDVDIDDLNIKFHRDIKSDPYIFSNLKRSIDYINGKEDIELENKIESALSKTEMKGYDIFLLSFYAIGYQPIFLAFCHYIKKRFGKIIIGGGLNRFNIEKVLMDKNIVDYFIVGYGQDSIVELLKKLRNKASLDEIKKISGLAFCNGNFINNEYVYTSYNLNIKPDFDGLPIEAYKRKIRGRKIAIIPFKFDQRCDYSCTFCPTSIHYQKNNEILGPKIIVQRIKELKERYNIPYFAFFNNTFNSSARFVEEFCTEVIDNKLDIYWTDSARLDAHTLTDKNIELMRKAGCIGLCYGLESASQRMLNYIEKGVTLKNASMLLKKLSEAGIWNEINLIAGLPHEREEDIDNTIEFLNNHSEMNNDDTLTSVYL